MQITATNLISLNDSRAETLQAVVCALQIFNGFGFSYGLSGHITARDPEHTDIFWMNPLEIPFGDVRLSDLRPVLLSGEPLCGRGSVNDSGIELHAHIYERRRDVNSIVHVHCPYGKAFSSLRKELAPVTQDACAFYEDHVLLNTFDGVAADSGYGRLVADTLGHRKAIILANHGFLTVGPTVEAASWWYLAMSDAARVQMLAGDLAVPLSKYIARRTAFQIGGHKAGASNARPMFNSIKQQRSDLFDALPDLRSKKMAAE
ncbi:MULTISPECIES: class II aldolase/adducin family protein [unclassified Caballeronia]|uniref:class II aldolase/adducin family protein n=1 Tax=unclassified Caballeronia TaxID=2646786 RepID=UPI002864D8E6|nr:MULTISPECIES: class II aldolase/adducin family protein [unclassified Caballeronia]MDR5777259.1 class II aldolase/adducin family protein [Caballeronia sp. LZ002]MDR5798891.1 class II aldolase/adducin family protein [Caballeronia sp. LZ001]MDR5852697.1 class II aldolase/adducin family protein [Caballeronia sp. LZ003]